MLVVIAMSPEAVFHNIVGEMGLWTTSSGSLPRPNWPQFLQEFYNATPKLFAIVSTAGYSLVSSPFAVLAFIADFVCAVLLIRKVKKREDLKHDAMIEFFVILSPCIIVLLYFIFMSTHAVVHIPVFGYKNWCLVYANVILAYMFSNEHYLHGGGSSLENKRQDVIYKRR